MDRRIWSILVAAVAIPASAANFSGRWAIQSAAGRAGGGRGAPTILTLNQAGNEVTGSITVRIDPGTSSPVNTEVLGGKVDGEVLSFYVWTGTDQPVKTSYRGTLSPSGEEIAFTVSAGRAGAGGQANVGAQPQQGQTASAAVPGRGQPAGPLQVTAKRAK
jgi:hypothetical protein